MLVTYRKYGMTLMAKKVIHSTVTGRCAGTGTINCYGIM
jgi:hypothetical protein